MAADGVVVHLVLVHAQGDRELGLVRGEDRAALEVAEALRVGGQVGHPHGVHDHGAGQLGHDPGQQGLGVVRVHQPGAEQHGGAVRRPGPARSRRPRGRSRRPPSRAEGRPSPRARPRRAPRRRSAAVATCSLPAPERSSASAASRTAAGGAAGAADDEGAAAGLLAPVGGGQRPVPQRGGGDRARLRGHGRSPCRRARPHASSGWSCPGPRSGRRRTRAPAPRPGPRRYDVIEQLAIGDCRRPGRGSRAHPAPPGPAGSS